MYKLTNLKIRIMKKSTLLTMMATMCFALSAQNSDVEVKTGEYAPQWQSLSKWECPEWFMDAKFGIWAHWGPQCHAEAGDWYARFMYYAGTCSTLATPRSLVSRSCVTTGRRRTGIPRS